MVFADGVSSDVSSAADGSQLEGLWHAYTTGEKLHILYRIVLYQYFP